MVLASDIPIANTPPGGFGDTLPPMGCVGSQDES